MDQNLKHRVIGVALLIAIAAIFLPILFKKSPDVTVEQPRELTLPKEPSAPEMAFTDAPVKQDIAPAAEASTVTQPSAEPEATSTVSPLAEEAEAKLDARERQAASAAANNDVQNSTKSNDNVEPEPAPAPQSKPDPVAEPESVNLEKSELTTQSLILPEGPKGEHAKKTLPEDFDRPVPKAPARPAGSAIPEPTQPKMLRITRESDMTVATTAKHKKKHVTVKRNEHKVAVVSKQKPLPSSKVSQKAKAGEIHGFMGASIAKPAVSTGAYQVQLASFKDHSNALLLQKQLQSRGYPAVIERGSSSISRVCVGGASNRQDAERLQRRLSQEFHLNGVIVSPRVNKQ